MRKITFVEWVAVAVALLVAAFLFAPSMLPFMGWFGSAPQSADNVGEEETAAALVADNAVLGENMAVPNISTEAGLEIYEIQKATSTGATASAGKQVSVHYIGALTDGTVFDSSLARGTPFTFTLGQGEVISGWDIGVAGMTVGDVRRLVISPELGYGANGTGPIPPNATLIFEVQLLGVQ